MWDTGSKVEFKDFEMNLGNNVKCFHIALEGGAGSALIIEIRDLFIILYEQVLIL